MADRRRDGVLPMQMPGVAETFGDELELVAALQLRWHTRLAGTIERELMEEPMDLEAAVVSAAYRPTPAEEHSPLHCAGNRAGSLLSRVKAHLAARRLKCL